MENLVIDKAVGLTALKLYIENSNMEVGQVTVRHLIFSELVVQVRAAKGLKDAEEVFKLCFGNTHTIKEGKGKKVYESPLLAGYYTDEFGIPCIRTTTPPSAPAPCTSGSKTTSPSSPRIRSSSKPSSTKQC